MFNLLGSGLNFSGIEKYVVLPMMQQLRLKLSVVSVVFVLKKFISCLRRHGSPPLIPIPRSLLAKATMMSKVFIVSKGRQKLFVVMALPLPTSFFFLSSPVLDVPISFPSYYILMLWFSNGDRFA